MASTSPTLCANLVLQSPHPRLSFIMLHRLRSVPPHPFPAPPCFLHRPLSLPHLLISSPHLLFSPSHLLLSPSHLFSQSRLLLWRCCFAACCLGGSLVSVASGSRRARGQPGLRLIQARETPLRKAVVAVSLRQLG